MSRYLLLMKASEHASHDLLASGSEGLKHQQSRIEAIPGAKVIDYYLVVGQHDIVSIVELGDEVDVLLLELMLNSSGLYTQVLRIYAPEELDQARQTLMQVPLLHGAS